MKTYNALFRGINVGGSNTLSMKDLVLLLEDIGCRNVKTSIHSGDAVFRSIIIDALQLSTTMGAETKRHRGFAPVSQAST
jgi:uncharacterized protein (DUF1697 family)